MLTTLLIYLMLGAVAGLLAGLFGVGGGAIIVPVLIYALEHQGIPAKWLTHIAIGTSLAVICIASISSVWAHHKKHLVLWPVVKMMTPGLVIGVGLGVVLIQWIPGHDLQWIIGIYLLIVAVQMGFQLMPAREQAVLPTTLTFLVISSFIGGISALFGIGGGSLTVPFLSYFGTQMKKAVATSSACGLPIAFMGTASNMLSGWSKTDLPDWTMGFVYIPAFIGIAVLSAPMATIGAKISQNLPPIMLKRLFAVFLVMIGSSLIIKTVGY